MMGNVANHIGPNSKKQNMTSWSKSTKTTNNYRNTHNKACSVGLAYTTPDEIGAKSKIKGDEKMNKHVEHLATEFSNLRQELATYSYGDFVYFDKHECARISLIDKLADFGEKLLHLSQDLRLASENI